MTLARRFQRRHAVRERRETFESAGPRGHFLSTLARHAGVKPVMASAPRPRRRAFDAAELARAHMLAEALHPDGHCTCGGGGSCEWCRSHCLFCGCSLTGAFCAACGQEAGP